MAYYGMRGVLILYAITQFEVPRDTALYHYSFLTLAICVFQVIGGFLGDFLLGSRNAILLGFGLCVGGSITLAIQDPIVFYIGIFLISLGSGFSRTNTFSMISQCSTYSKEILEKRFIAMYGFINLGAFLSSIVIGVIGEQFGYFYSFMIILFLYGVGLGLIFAMSFKANTRFTPQSGEDVEPKSITASLLIIILLTISSAIFWIIFELYSTNILPQKIEMLQNHYDYASNLILWTAPVVLILLLSIPYYFLAKFFSLYTKIAIALLLLGICCFFAVFVYSKEFVELGAITFLILMLIEGIADIFLTPAALSILAINTSKKYYGTIFGVYSIFIYLGTRLLYYFEDSQFEVFFKSCLVLFLVTAVVLFFILPFILKENSLRDLSQTDDLDQLQ